MVLRHYAYHPMLFSTLRIVLGLGERRQKPKARLAHPTERLYNRRIVGRGCVVKTSGRGCQPKVEMSGSYHSRNVRFMMARQPESVLALAAPVCATDDSVLGEPGEGGEAVG